jgi:hypothetical protein
MPFVSSPIGAKRKSLNSDPRTGIGGGRVIRITDFVVRSQESRSLRFYLFSEAGPYLTADDRVRVGKYLAKAEHDCRAWIIDAEAEFQTS